ncbi:hypothetical protein BGZ97_012752 [Linnemannia gamsii]|uniref:RRM domain-containing protein n=1 Tax=Linnemannia gamsii TaxID=64522 RepID=A0A9P6UL60_9FUNG|nr:hypothetical protein BGZ97_012752 [Linnemannia gamsii]
MELMDQSLDDIIKQDKLSKKIAQKPSLKAPKLTALPKPRSPYRRPVHKEAPLFTETYKAWNAPVTAIYTSGYVPKTGSIKLVVYNNRNSKSKKDIAGASTSAYETGAKSGIRLSTTQRTRTDSYRPSTTAPGGKSSQGDFYRPEPSGSGRHGSGQRRNSRDASRSSSLSASHGYRDDRRKNSSTWDSAPVSGMGIDEVRKLQNKKSQGSGSSNSDRNIDNGKGKDNHGNARRGSRSTNNSAPLPPMSDNVADANMDIVEIKQEEEEQVITIKGAAPVEVDTVNGPVTIEIDNLDRGTTAEDVKVVCSRFGEIKSCVCSNGFSQVTYARRAAGIAAVETLNGKKADNNQILRVTMLKAPIFHNVTITPSPHVPSSIAGPMKLLTRAVQGTITNAGSIYSNQLIMAQQVLKMQQHRVAQLHLEEQEMTLRRIQGVTGGVPVLVSSPALQDLTQSPAREDYNSGLL